LIAFTASVNSPLFSNHPCFPPDLGLFCYLWRNKIAESVIRETEGLDVPAPMKSSPSESCQAADSQPYLPILNTFVPQVGQILAIAEERGCLERFSDVYRDYMNRTPRCTGLP